MFLNKNKRHSQSPRKGTLYFGYLIKNFFNSDISTLFTVKFLGRPNTVNKLIFQSTFFQTQVRFGGVFFLSLLLFASCKSHHFNANHSHKSSADSIAKQVNQNPHTMKKTDPSLPYRQIPEAPKDFTSGNVIARMIDGLGYRYYWATEGLNETDLAYRSSESGRTSYETLEHIYGLSETIVNAPQNKPNIRPTDWSDLTYETMRKRTLNNLKLASDILRGKSESDVAKMKVIFQRGEKSSEFPYWNMLNGPIADAMWHTGQVVMLRRASGNPLPKGVNVFMGKTKE